MSLTANFVGPTLAQRGSCRLHVGPTWAQRALLSGIVSRSDHKFAKLIYSFPLSASYAVCLWALWRTVTVLLRDSPIFLSPVCPGLLSAGLCLWFIHPSLICWSPLVIMDVICQAQWAWLLSGGLIGWHIGQIILLVIVSHDHCWFVIF